MRSARREIVNFISVFVSKNKDDQQSNKHFSVNYAPHLLTIIELYQNEPDNLREPEVIDLAANIVCK